MTTGEGRLGLRVRIAVAIAAICLVSIIVVVGYLRHALERQATAQWSRERGQVAAALAAGFDRSIDAMIGDLRFVAGLPAMAGLPDLARLDRTINGIPVDADTDKRRILDELLEDERFSVLFVLQPNGDHYLSHPFTVQRLLKRFNLADRPYFQQAASTGRPVVSDAFMGADGIPAVAIDVPRLDHNGTVTLHLGGVIHLPKLTEIFSTAILPPFDMGMLIDRQGTVIAAAGRGQTVEAPDTALAAAAKTFQGTSPIPGKAVVRTYFSQAGNEEVIASFIRLHNGWTVALARPRSSFVEEIAPEVTRISTMVGALLLLVSAMGFAIAHHIAGRWDGARRALSAAHGELEARVRERTAALDSSRRELAAKSRTLETILDNISQGISVYDDDLRMVACNRRFAELLRLPADMARPGTRLEDYLRFNALRGDYGPGDPERQVAERIDLARHFKPHRFQRQRADGTALEIIGNPLPGGGFVATHTDVTEAKRAEEALRTLSRAVEQSPVSVVITDPRGNIDYVNPKFVEVCGYTPEEVKGLNPRFLKSGLTPDEVYADLWRTIAAGRTWEGDLQNRKKNGDLYWERASVSPIRSPDGVILHYLAVKEDITARKASEDALLAAMQAAEDANRAKTVFLSHMSHELRTPLTAVLGYAEMMESEMAGPLPRHNADFVAAIADSGRHLLSIIDEVLDISRIEMGSYRIANNPADLAAIARECVAMLQPQCIAKDIELTLDADKAMPLVTDARAIRQILINLLGNAVKYTESGGRIAVTLGHGEQGLRVAVADTGIGIPADKLAHVFEPFQRVDPLRANPARGVGLGLAICRRIAGLLGGAISIESQPGLGTTVTLLLPEDTCVRAPQAPGGGPPSALAPAP
ncbi:Signal transduction histidine kinase [Paramagnetospirillum caucaseum]|uniref:histidine kinase n=1 Tax=Paramagnetospirillum caucaseum TaxID=1244869 RepID=M2ZW25_9PROT|nr:PAS-domain containing protein [Paramagnetospirillum caucaseum]EME71592.1 Signal transduction histidine kinase [Paramagnetospirillum caucaseum]